MATFTFETTKEMDLALENEASRETTTAEVLFSALVQRALEPLIGKYGADIKQRLFDKYAKLDEPAKEAMIAEVAVDPIIPVGPVDPTEHVEVPPVRPPEEPAIP